jgi:PDZ domain-containing secreted protein
VSATAVLRRALVDALGSTWLLVVALTFTVFALVTGVLFVIPTPYQVLLPGPVTDVQSLIVPSPHRSKGALLLTTIYSDPASIGEWLYAKTNRRPASCRARRPVRRASTRSSIRSFWSA